MSNLPSTCPEEETFEGTETWEKRIFDTFFEFEREGFKVLQKFSAEPSELRFTYPGDQFQENLFLKCDVFAWFLGRRARRFGLFAKSIFLEISKNNFTCSKLCFCGNFCLKIGLHIQSSSKKDSVPLWKSLGSVVKTLCLVSTRSYWRTFFFRIIYQILSFRTLSVNFLDVWQTFFAWFVKTAFYGFRGHFWSKNFEWNLNNLLVHKRRFLLRLLFGICASHPRIPGDGNCGCFARGFLVGLLKLNLSCPEDTIGEKRFSKYSSYSSFLDCQQKFLGCLGEIFLVEKEFPSVCDFKLMTFRLRLQRKLLAEKYFCG